ncbi:MAG: LysR family transcriptional regulator [Streptosporangiaceae bacterium]|nr:LysR family transcriptional regulator [Streptosporangiaceae bacterium]MBV9854911.1 LysR family transcriptional regulator [Streptosporangiaceae bacterium]
MDTAEIEVFLVLAEELHFGRTAERLRIPQPRVSRLLAALERRAGGTLFERTSRRVRLTPLGQQLASQLRPAYAQLIAVLDDARARATEAVGVIRIGFSPTSSTGALTRLVEAFEARNPGCRAVLGAVSNLDPYTALRHGELDVLVNWLAVDEPDLTVGPVIDERDRVLAVASGDPLAARPSVSAEDLADREVALMTPPFPPALYDAIIPPRTPSGRPIRRTQPVHGIHELVALVARGQIVHPTASGIPMLVRDDIVLVPIEDMPPLPLGLIWCTAHDNARVQALAATARSLRRQAGPKEHARTENPASRARAAAPE